MKERKEGVSTLRVLVILFDFKVARVDRIIGCSGYGKIRLIDMHCTENQLG